MRYSTPSWPSRHTLKMMILGTVSFWVPDAAWHAIRGREFDGRDALALTGLLPLTFWGTYVAVKRLYKNTPSKSLGGPMILGVWLFGGFFMAFGAFLGKGNVSDALN